MESKYNEACDTLEICCKYDDDILETTLTKQYRKLSLIYHPDKNKSVNSSEEFQKINDAYQYLCKHLGYIDDDDYDYDIDNLYDYGDDVYWDLNWMNTLNKVIDNNNILKFIKELIVHKIINQDTVIRYMERLDRNKLIELQVYLRLNKERLNISDFLLVSLSNIINFTVNIPVGSK
jgi:hypothetical protein